MQKIWFERTRWFWRPITVTGRLVLVMHALLTLMLNLWIFTFAADPGSAVFRVILCNGLSFLGLDWLARRTSYRDGRKLYRHQRDPESWT